MGVWRAFRARERFFDWIRDGDTSSRFYEWMKMSALSAEFFDSHAARVGALITGRRTYDVSGAWGGSGPLRGAPLFVMTHQVLERSRQASRRTRSSVAASRKRPRKPGSRLGAWNWNLLASWPLHASPN
jgi:hypothetical protein